MNKQRKILVVDDDAGVIASLGLMLKQAGYLVGNASNPAEAVIVLEADRFDLVLQDMNFSRRTSGEEGLQLISRIKAGHPHLPVILMTAWGSVSLAVRGVKMGASDFITKPWTNEQILHSIKTALGLAEIRRNGLNEPPASRAELDAKYDFSRLIGQDPAFLKILDIISRISATDASVLITGESGTGKELVADAIYRNSNRKNAPYVKVNLGGITTSLFESEMFGHVKGAFTDAKFNRTGRFEAAHNGTIFLDEIGDLDPVCQVKLLRVLQDRTFERVGSSQSQTINFRVISATNKNLTQMAAEDSFREDLLYRLNLITIHLPSLAERQGDIPLLANAFVRNIAQEYSREGLSVSEDAINWLMTRSWKGNIRHLRQVIERTVLLSRQDSRTKNGQLTRDEFQLAMQMHNDDSNREDAIIPGNMTLDDMERQMVMKACLKHNGNVSQIARSLGISRSALYRRLKKHGIEI